MTALAMHAGPVPHPSPRRRRPPEAAVLISLAAGLLALSCDAASRAEARPEPPESTGPSAPAPSGAAPSGAARSTVSAPRGVRSPIVTRGLDEVTWDFPRGPFGPTRVVVAVPRDASPTRRLPVLVAFHGRGEALKGMRRGARGWLDDYELGAAARRLGSGRVTREDLHGFVTDERLAYFRRQLEAQPYGGLIVVCPYLPDVLRGTQAFREGKALADFIADELLQRVYRDTPSLPKAAVDGVSLGGRAALLVGLLRPDAFQSVGALQPAVDDAERPRWTTLAQTALRENPHLSIRLLTSDEDYFLAATKNLGAAWRDASIDVTVDVVTGPHDYVFNRGPGAYEMLLHHDRALRSD